MTTSKERHVTAKHPTRTKAGKAMLSLVVLALLAVALQSLVLSDASFTAGTANPANIFAAGSLSHTNTKAGTVIVDAANLRPGQSKEGRVTIADTGTLAGVYALSKGTVVDTPATPGLSRTLRLLIQEDGVAAPLYDNTVALMPATLTLGPIAPGLSRSYTVRLTYRTQDANPALQGATMTLPLQFTGVAQ
jgi:spore coat-associated protein N